MNLTILLLSSRRFVSKEHIRDVIDGYADLNDAAFERMFERDKDELREMGIPIVTGSNDKFFDDEIGYRIDRQDFELPPLEFDADEQAILSLAAGVWQQANVADQASDALTKLKAAGLSLDTDRMAALAPRLSPREAAFEPLWQAIGQRRVVRFHYRGSDEERVVEPWNLSLRANSWYLLGFDQSRQAERVFKLARITSEPKLGPADGFQTPPDVDERVAARLAEIDDADVEAIVAVRSGRAPALRRRGVQLASVEGLPAGFDVWQVRLPGRGAAYELASYGPDVLVLEPAALRAAVVAHLESVIERHGGER